MLVLVTMLTESENMRSETALDSRLRGNDNVEQVGGNLNRHPAMHYPVVFSACFSFSCIPPKFPFDMTMTTSPVFAISPTFAAIVAASSR